MSESLESEEMQEYALEIEMRECKRKIKLLRKQRDIAIGELIKFLIDFKMDKSHQDNH